MKLSVFSVKDAAVGAFLPPFFARSRGEAIRSFEQAALDGERFAKHAKDYDLYHCGDWNDETGCFSPFDFPERICGALDFAGPVDT